MLVHPFHGGGGRPKISAVVQTYEQTPIIITKHLYSTLQRTQHLKTHKQTQRQRQQLYRKQERFKGTPEGRHRQIPSDTPGAHSKVLEQPPIKKNHQRTPWNVGQTAG